jgi:hypothetical protein
MEKIICKIEIGINTLDDDYTFYENGTIHRSYDENNWNQNLSKFILPEHISESKKNKIIEKCPSENLEKIKEILTKKNIS